MVKYYWYINMDPEKHPDVYNINSYVKRSLTQPTKDYYYVTETIDGYNHTIKGKLGERISSVNDNGSPTTLNSIHNSIIEILRNRYSMDKEEMIENMMEKRKSIPMDNWRTSGSIMPFDDGILLETMRRKNRIKIRMNAKKPKYKRKVVTKKRGK